MFVICCIGVKVLCHHCCVACISCCKAFSAWRCLAAVSNMEVPISAAVTLRGSIFPLVRVRPTSPFASLPTNPLLAVRPKRVGETRDATAKTGAALLTTLVAPLTTFFKNLPSLSLKAVHLLLGRFKRCLSLLKNRFH